MPDWAFPLAAVMVAVLTGLIVPFVVWIAGIQSRVKAEARMADARLVALESRYLGEGGSEPLGLERYASRRYVDDRFDTSGQIIVALNSAVKTLKETIERNQVIENERFDKHERRFRETLQTALDPLVQRLGKMETRP